MFFLCSSSDMAEELRLPAAARCPHVRPAAGEGHALGRGRHAAFLRHPSDGDTGRDDNRVSRRDTRDSGESSHSDTVCGVQCRWYFGHLVIKHTFQWHQVTDRLKPFSQRTACFRQGCQVWETKAAQRPARKRSSESSHRNPERCG